MWSRLVKEVYGRHCHWCQRKDLVIHADHICNRHKFATRWVIENGIPLCGPCHLFRKKRDPAEWYKIVCEDRGEELVQDLIKLSNSGEKIDLDQVKIYLEGIEFGFKKEAQDIFGRT